MFKDEGLEKNGQSPLSAPNEHIIKTITLTILINQNILSSKYLSYFL